MPLVIPRTGPVDIPNITCQDRSKLWDNIVRNYAEAHPEIFADAIRRDKEDIK